MSACRCALVALPVLGALWLLGGCGEPSRDAGAGSSGSGAGQAATPSQRAYSTAVEPAAGATTAIAVAPTDTAPAHASASAPEPRVASSRRPSRNALLRRLRPPLVQRRIALTTTRVKETDAYSKRHYGVARHVISRPRVIVEHITVTPDFASVYNTFALDRPDVELQELPGLCTHFVVDRDGTIYQLTRVTFLCRHTVGLNHTAIGIEHVGRTDAEVLGNDAQMRASLRLTRWLRCRHEIGAANVIGHNESLSSPHHHERVARLRTQTHGDWVPADMRIYRNRLRALGACP